jgi:hypothetical protein
VTLLALAFLAGGAASLSGCTSGEITEPLSAKGKGLTVCSGSHCYHCTGALSHDIPADGNFYLTSFGGPTDSTTRGRRTACGGSVDQLWWYSTSAARWGCGTKLRVVNPSNGKCGVVQVSDSGPALCTEQAAGRPILDASPLLSRHLFGTSSAGWSDHYAITVEQVDDSTPSGPCDGSAAPSPAPSPAPTPAPAPSPAPSPHPSSDPGSDPAASTDPGSADPGTDPGSSDPNAALCAQLGYAGECNGSVLTWCENGQVKQVDCATTGATCGFESADVGNNCLAASDPSSGSGSSSGSSSGGGATDNCDGVDYLGYCTSDGTLVWCDGGVLKAYDCAADGLTCQYVDDTTGNTCVQTS